MNPKPRPRTIFAMVPNIVRKANGDIVYCPLAGAQTSRLDRNRAVKARIRFVKRRPRPLVIDGGDKALMQSCGRENTSDWMRYIVCYLAAERAVFLFHLRFL